jgi:hypothetical protein
MMDEWTRSVFEWLTLDYSFDEIAHHLGMDTKILRNKYNRHVKALVKQVTGGRADRSWPSQA